MKHSYCYKNPQTITKTPTPNKPTNKNQTTNKTESHCSLRRTANFLCLPCMHHASLQNNGCTRSCWCQDALLTIANYICFHQREWKLKAAGTAKDWNFKLGINCNAVDRNCHPNSLNKYWHVSKCPLPTAFHNANSPALPGCHGNHRITPITPYSHFKFCCSDEALFLLHNSTCLLPKSSATTSSHHKVTKIRKFTTHKKSV